LKKYKKFILIFLILSLLMLMSACKKADNMEPTINADPPSIDIAETVPLDFEMETNYDNISVQTEFSTYPKDVEKIVYTITNHNIGKGFYYFSTPYIEYYAQDKWVRLAYYPPDYTEESNVWTICGIEGNREIEYSCNGIFYPQSVSAGIKEGQYRLVIFVGDTKVFSEFKFND